MEFIADLHIHSHYSIATSKKLSPEYLDYWAKVKGIRVVGTGDFTHPSWVAELKEKLEPAEDGLYKLKNDFKLACPIVETDSNSVRFILSAEISNIYKKDGKVRKVHNIVLAPNFDIVDKIQQKLSSLNFNITSDGRPILGLDSRDLLEICLEASEDIFFIPAHIWTPWFSVLGSKSGFDTIEECYGDLSDHIYALETGLSTDPPMNWMCSILDKYTLLSNSDAHSPEKLGRNANIFLSELDYFSITNALKKPELKQFGGTFDMFPQEGKYHFDGHRKCGICWSPLETLKHNGICPVCGKKVVIGVTNRVAELSDRGDILEKENRLPFHYIIPLKEILSEIHGVSENSKKVTLAYNQLIQKVGSEFNILHYASIDELKENTNTVLAEAIRRMREHKVLIKEGYDGEYGRISVFRKDEHKLFENQDSLFGSNIEEIEEIPKRKLINFDLSQFRKLNVLNQSSDIAAEPSASYELNIKEEYLKGMNKQQYDAATHFENPAIIMAGPGTGKTSILTKRIVYLIQEKNINPENILAVTFTNKAAEEMGTRFKNLSKSESNNNLPTICTFHALGYSILREYGSKLGRSENFTIIDENDKNSVLESIGVQNKKDHKKLIDLFSSIKQNPEKLETNPGIKDKFIDYNAKLKEFNLFDLDDMIYQSLLLLKKNSDVLETLREKYQWILIDEFQDINQNQYELIRLLHPNPNSNLFAIGDPNQSIYGFRGSSTKFISQLISDYTDINIHKLITSYRCSDNILQASANIINDTDFLRGLDDGVKINISSHQTDKSEAEFIARKIESLSGGLRFFSMDSKVSEGESDEEIVSLSDFAILCRTKAQMQSIEKALTDHTIPYQLATDNSFFDNDHIQIILDIIKYSENPDNEFFKVKLEKYLSKIDILNLKDRTGIVRKIELIVESLFIENKDEFNIELQKLTELASVYNEDISDFFKQISLGQESDMLDYNTEKVSLLTIHASKGLEFKCVFIAGCENGLLPNTLYHDDQDIEEEKRLLYVAMTRAKSKLYLSHAKKRFFKGRELQLAKSPFLNSIEKQLYEIEKIKVPKKKDDSQLKLF